MLKRNLLKKRNWIESSNFDHNSKTVSYEWKEKFKSDCPFSLSYYLFKEVEILREDGWIIQGIPRYKVIQKDFHAATVSCVSTEEYPLAWAYWWLAYRILDSIELSQRWLVYFLDVWDLPSVSNHLKKKWNLW